MFDRIKYWYHDNYIQITWFIIGWLVMAGLEQIGRGNGIGALIDFGLAYVNYALYRR